VDKKLAQWEEFYNFHRPHPSLHGKAPYEVLRGKLSMPIDVRRGYGIHINDKCHEKFIFLLNAETTRSAGKERKSFSVFPWYPCMAFSLFLLLIFLIYSPRAFWTPMKVRRLYANVETALHPEGKICGQIRERA
jgi:hypothetical protein